MPIIQGRLKNPIIYGKFLCFHMRTRKFFFENICHLPPKHSFLTGYKQLNLIADEFY